MSRPGSDRRLIQTLASAQTIAPNAGAPFYSPVIVIGFENRFKYYGNVVSLGASVTGMRIWVQGSGDGVVFYDEAVRDYSRGGPVTAGVYDSPVGTNAGLITNAGQTFMEGVVADMPFYRVAVQATGTGGNALTFNLYAIQSLL